MSKTLPIALQQWHQFVETKKPKILNDLLAEEAVFHSPVVFTPQKGKPITFMYLMAAIGLLNSSEQFQYNRTVVDGNTFVLEFTTELDGITINGIDFITVNDDQKIIDFKVMVRPLKGMNKLHEKMAEALSRMK
ncbi:MAG TPA: nuclear transport factor 2 family protein [Chitinophagales bacterium]|nr:nuclear transport factor 2 family protein [Chitinophagales bacterium]